MKDIIRVGLGFDLFIYRRDVTIGSDQEGNAFCSEKLAAEEFLRSPDIIQVYDCFFNVRQERKRQSVFVGKTPMARYGICAHAQNNCVYFLEHVKVVPERTSFGGAAWRHVFRIEIQHYPVTAVLGECMSDAVLIGQGEIRGGRINFKRGFL